MASRPEYKGEVPVHDQYGPEAKYAVDAEAFLPTATYEEEIARGLELGLPGADSIKDRRIPTRSTFCPHLTWSIPVLCIRLIDKLDWMDLVKGPLPTWLS